MSKRPHGLSYTAPAVFSPLVSRWRIAHAARFALSKWRWRSTSCSGVNSSLVGGMASNTDVLQGKRLETSHHRTEPRSRGAWGQHLFADSGNAENGFQLGCRQLAQGQCPACWLASTPALHEL